MMRRRLMLTGMLAAPALALAGPARAQRALPPHAWLFGSWTGGQFPPGDIAGAECFSSPTVIFTRDAVMRASALEVTFRQRTIETVAQVPDGVEFRFTPLPLGLAPNGTPVRTPPEYSFGCGSNPNVLRVERRGPDEIFFPGCSDYPAVLRRCR